MTYHRLSHDDTTPEHVGRQTAILSNVVDIGEPAHDSYSSAESALLKNTNIRG